MKPYLKVYAVLGTVFGLVELVVIHLFLVWVLLDDHMLKTTIISYLVKLT